MTEARTERHEFRLTVREKKKLETLAEKSNLSISEYVRVCCLKGTKVTITYEYE